MKVILHADDLGISTKVNTAIFRYMEEGKITSASILANGPAFAEAACGARNFPQCSFGVHLNITEFEPLRRPAAWGTLISSEGQFLRIARNRWFDNKLRRSILDEWAAQIKRIRQAGIAITHIDSHHHIHTHIALFSGLKQLCHSEDIRRVRPRQTFGARSAVSAWRIDNRLYNRTLHRNFLCVDEFGPFAGFASTKLACNASVELMLHPGNPRYEAETQSFAKCVDSDFRRKHECVTYQDLP